MSHLETMLTRPGGPLRQFVTLATAGVLVYFALSGLSYLALFVLGRRRFNPEYRRERGATARAIRLALVGNVGSVALLMPFNVLIARGHSRIYWHLGQHGGVPWLVASVALYVMLVDAAIYWIHRGMHTPLLMRHVHRYHHGWRRPTSWVSMAFHPLDSLALALPTYVVPLVLPVHGGVFLAMQGLMACWSVASHDRVSVLRRPWFNYAANHTLHHWFFRCNYGQFFTLWDRLMGTWRDPMAEARAGTVPAELLPGLIDAQVPPARAQPPSPRPSLTPQPFALPLVRESQPAAP